MWRTGNLCDAEGIHDVAEIHGFIVIRVAVTRRMDLYGHTCTPTYVCRRFVLLDGDPTDALPLSWEWRAVKRSRVAVLDHRVWTLAHHWVAVATNLTRRAALLARRGQLHQAISQLPRVEDRLLALFWSLAEQRGTVRPDGVWLPFPVTHGALAEMIGGRRPTVSLGLARLAERAW